MAHNDWVRTNVESRGRVMETIVQADPKASEWMLTAESIIASMTEDQRKQALLALARTDSEAFKRVSRHGVRFGAW